MKSLKARLFVGLQYLLPRFLLTAVIFRLARVRHIRVKNVLIRTFVRLFSVDTAEAAAAVPDEYETFNAFFTRELKPDARRIDSAKRSIVSPVDGTVSEAGIVSHGMLLQAKNHKYSLHDLLATDLEAAASFEDGHFVTIYLAPHNYHRIHAPLAGRLTAARYVPGDLFSVNEATVSALPGLFVRNERLVCHFTTDIGPIALLFVGALNVGSISTPWTGEIRPRATGMVEQMDLARSGIDTTVPKGGLLGWFNMGSTVILLLPRGACELRDPLVSGTPLRMGESIATSTGVTA